MFCYLVTPNHAKQQNQQTRYFPLLSVKNTTGTFFETCLLLLILKMDKAVEEINQDMIVKV